MQTFIAAASGYFDDTTTDFALSGPDLSQTEYTGLKQLVSRNLNFILHETRSFNP
jgi:hypothetical protein